MVTKHVDLRLKGTIADIEAVDAVLNAIEEVEPKRTWAGFFWELDLKYKIVMLALIAYVGYAAYLWYMTGSIYAIIEATMPLIETIIETIKGMITG